MNLGTALGIGVVRTYQWTLRPLIGANCRFHPSCSDYAIEAFQTHGGGHGAWLAGKRILRCNPWHPGGLDLVPPRPILPGPTPSPDDRTGS
ncbi:MAG: membrane protein insertion efficiency factor YidD [Acetobacteraceae bacterium]|nr:membrane protein insertion efficiency factor YidD [Acetobacteraceae bacterium]